MQGIQHIKFTNSPSFAANPGALIAKSISIYHQLNADQVEAFDRTGQLPADIVDAAVAQGFDDFAIVATVRNVHEAY